MKRDLIQFGKKHIVKELFGDGYAYKVGNITTSPAVYCRSDKKIEVLIDPLTEIHTFSNGSELMSWIDSNCSDCKKDGNCALQYRLYDGKIPFKTLERIGYSRLSIQANGANFGKLNSKCKKKQ